MEDIRTSARRGNVAVERDQRSSVFDEFTDQIRNVASRASGITYALEARNDRIIGPEPSPPQGRGEVAATTRGPSLTELSDAISYLNNEVDRLSYQVERQSMLG